MAVILIVEDDDLLAEGLAEILRRAGYSPVVASDARSGEREAMELPDLILLDLVLPDLPGQELLQRLKSRVETADIPVVIVTGYDEAAAQVRALGIANVAGILLKPVSGAELCQAVAAALAQRQAQDTGADSETQRQQELIRRLILEGADALVFHLYRRLSADRTKGRGSTLHEILTWTEIAEWARRERLLDAEQARLLRRRQAAGSHGSGKRAG